MDKLTMAWSQEIIVSVELLTREKDDIDFDSI
jgi:hypothetical protein